MASKFNLGNAAVNAAADAVGRLLDGGRLRIYSGPQPADADAPPGRSAVLLAELRFATRAAFRPASFGVAEANDLEPESSAKATGRAAWFRAVRKDGTAIFDGSVGLAGADLNLNALDIQADAIVAIARLAYVHPKAER